MVWKEPGQFVSEPIFVPRHPCIKNLAASDGIKNKSNPEPGNKEASEDDGVVIFTLLSNALQKYVQVCGRI